MEYPPDEDLAGRTVTIRRTKDPFGPKPEYIAYSKVTLDDCGWLDLGNLGVGDGNGSSYSVVMAPGQRAGKYFGSMVGRGNLLPSWRVREALDYGEDNAVTVVTYKDKRNAVKRRWRAKLYENRKRSMEDWMEWAGSAIEQWFEGAEPSPTIATTQAIVRKVLEGEDGAKDDGDNVVLKVVTERSTALVGSGLIRRRGGRKPTME